MGRQQTCKKTTAAPITTKKPTTTTTKAGSCGFKDWKTGLPCANKHGNCENHESGYFWEGIFQNGGKNWACWWHTKNQGWNTNAATNFYHLAKNFGLDPKKGGSSWCYPFKNNPCTSGSACKISSQ